MALIDRLGGIGNNPENIRKLPVEYFWAMLYELAQGKTTKQNIIDLFALDAEESAELQWLIDRYNAQLNSTAKAKYVELIRVILVLAEAKAPGYTTNAQLVARINGI